MDEEEAESSFGSALSFITGAPPSLAAALVVAIPFIGVSAFNYFSAGAALVVSLPVLAVLYAGCGALAGRFAASRGTSSSGFLLTGAAAGLILWAISMVANVILSLIVGTATLGITLLLGVPYLCLCAPVEMIGGALIGGLGVFGLFGGQSPADSEADV